MFIHKAKVLLVDDEPLILDMFEKILQSRGFDITCAMDVRSAVSHLSRTHFDILICDVLLEPLDGFDLEIIAKEKFPNIRTFLMTGAPNAIDAERAKALGILYFSKPLCLETLTDLLEEAAQSTSQVGIKRAA